MIHKSNVSAFCFRHFNLFNGVVFLFGFSLGFFSLYLGSFLLDSQKNPEATKSELMQHSETTASNCTRENSISKSYVEWNPHPDRYLVATCTLGQLTHRIHCFKKTLIIASLLNRTLIIPEEDLHPVPTGQLFSMAVSFPHLRSCLGDKVFTAKEFVRMQKKKRRLGIHRVMCWFPNCNWFDDHRNWKSMALPPTFEDYSNSMGHNVNVESIISTFGHVHEPVITFGDLFYVNHIFDYTELIPMHMRVNNQCKLIFKPHISIYQAARAFIRQILGSNFAALHLQHIYTKEDANFTNDVRLWSMHDAAECLHWKLIHLNITTLFIISDASEDEIAIARFMLSDFHAKHSNVFLVTLPDLTNQNFASKLNALGLATNPTVLTTLKKVIASFSTVFIASSSSAYSQEINEMRSLLNLFTCEDEFVCQGKAWNDPVWNSLNAIITS